MDKMVGKLHSLKMTHPRTSRELLKSFGGGLRSEHEYRLSHGFKIKDVSLIQREERKSRSNLFEADK